MKNIFENTYFGKPYKTMGGKRALYCMESEGIHYLIVDGWCDTIAYNNDGSIWNILKNNIDDVIVSEWQEEKTPEDIDNLINVAKEIAIEQKCISVYNKQKSIEDTYKEVLSCLSYQIHNKNIVAGIIKIRTSDNYKKYLPSPNQGELSGYCNWNLGLVWESIGMKVAKIIQDKHHINCQFVDKGISGDSYFKFNFNQ